MGLNVPTREYEIARVIAERASPGTWVLMPEAAGGWVVTFHDHPYPLMPRELYFGLMQHGRSLAEKDRRRELTEYVAGFTELKNGPSRLLRAIDRHDLRIVVTTPSAWSGKIYDVRAPRVAVPGPRASPIPPRSPRRSRTRSTKSWKRSRRSSKRSLSLFPASRARNRLKKIEETAFDILKTRHVHR